MINLFSKIKKFYELKPLEIFDKLRDKIYTFEIKKENIDTIVLGSSHCQYGYRANENEMNLGLSYEDLYYSWMIFKKCNNKNLKRVILFYSVFSPGYKLIKTRYSYMSICFNLICNFLYQDNDVSKKLKFQIMAKRYERKYKKQLLNFKYDNTYNGNEKDYFAWPTDVKSRALHHYKNNQRHNNQTEYVLKMAKLAKENGIDFYIVLSPASNKYKDLLPPSNELFTELYNSINSISHINVINLYDINFEDDEFVDFDHLGYNGAIKCTDIVRNYILTQEGRM